MVLMSTWQRHDAVGGEHEHDEAEGKTWRPFSRDDGIPGAERDLGGGRAPLWRLRLVFAFAFRRPSLMMIHVWYILIR